MKLALSLLALTAWLRADLPPAVESLRPSIQVAERRLQDISLELQAAKHAAEPLQGQVAEARRGAGSWWGSWMLQRSLGRLKTSLDRVESARAGQVAARQDLALLLTGADEELSAALEASLAGKTGRPDRSFLDKWRVWWEQKRAWQQRLDALEPAGDGEDSAEALGQEAKRIRQEARQAQWDREKAILDVLESRRALPSAEIRSERARLKARFSAVRP